MSQTPTRILVKTRVSAEQLDKSFGAIGAMKIEPLMPSIEPAAVAGATVASRWYAIESGARISPWDLCHELTSQGLAAGAAVEFAEPDLEQSWLTDSEHRELLSLDQECGAGDPQSKTYPQITTRDDWHRDNNHSGLEAALKSLGGDAAPLDVCIAHLDTGYDPSHASLPRQLDLQRQRNFVEKSHPNDAQDRAGSGMLTNPGHGTGTLGILAGNAVDGFKFGAAPGARIVPIRVANSVVLFRNSSIARALDYVFGLCGSPATFVDVITMSMGGLPSRAWVDAVNALYERGVVIVTAAGNNFGHMPVRRVVYPARFNRVIAACGIMANHKPYADLSPSVMAGNYGPASKMRTALGGYTPNVPWPRRGCAKTVDRDGNGTSSATPQVAAAAALYIAKHRAALANYSGWKRVEAVRHALFTSALTQGIDDQRVGRGALRAEHALQTAPPVATILKQEPADDVRFAWLKLFVGNSFAAAPNRLEMLELEALQLAQSADVEALLPEEESFPTPKQLSELGEVLAAQPGASAALRAALGHPARRSRPPSLPKGETSLVERAQLDYAVDPPVPVPSRRRLRVFAFDPSIGGELSTMALTETGLSVRYEPLQPGPVGEYLEVIDIDPANACGYAPVNLDDPHLLLRDGLPPTESNPQFHQQMVYAVAMRTIEHFETALGRVSLWAPRRRRDQLTGEVIGEDYVRRLRIYPHALRADNAYYSPERQALLFGYFEGDTRTSTSVLPGGTVFTALSHDIVAHESAHALLDGLHRHMREPSNLDVLAFHEAFADLVALFQHFGVREAVEHQIARTRGGLDQGSLLSELALEFGRATGQYGALRNAIRGRPEAGDAAATDESLRPLHEDYEFYTESHARGAVLVAAVFDAYLQIYGERSRDVLRLATNGTGRLQDGDISEVLVRELAERASSTARHVLSILIRALDYCPPVDLRFGDFLRALITADRDAQPDDDRSYRVAFIAAFRRRGIFPTHVRNMSVESVAWEPPAVQLEKLSQVLGTMQLGWTIDADRESTFNHSRWNARKLHKWLMDPNQVSDEEIALLGLVRHPSPVALAIVGRAGQLRVFQVHSVRPAYRRLPNGQSRSDLIVEITQTWRPDDEPAARFRGGCTIIIDLKTERMRFLIRKRVANPARVEAQTAFAAAPQAHGLHSNYFGEREARDEPFALLHGQR